MVGEIIIKAFVLTAVIGGVCLLFVVWMNRRNQRLLENAYKEAEQNDQYVH